MNLWIGLVAGACSGVIASVRLNRSPYFPFVRRGTKLFIMIVVSSAVALILLNSVLAVFGPLFNLKTPSGQSVSMLSIVFTGQQLSVSA